MKVQMEFKGREPKYLPSIYNHHIPKNTED